MWTKWDIYIRRRKRNGRDAGERVIEKKKERWRDEGIRMKISD